MPLSTVMIRDLRVNGIQMPPSACCYAESMRSTEQNYLLKDGGQPVGWAAFFNFEGLEARLRLFPALYALYFYPRLKNKKSVRRRMYKVLT